VALLLDGKTVHALMLSSIGFGDVLDPMLRGAVVSRMKE
jgi:hypothetical protein